MNIIVCVKQVPSTNQVEVDPVTGVLKRDGIDSKLNPYDLYALEAAFRIKDEYGATVKTLSMGPNQAMQSLYETMYMGADESVLLSDRKFAGADVQATSYAISSGIKQIGDFDLIICGKQTTDGDTAQVGPEVAEMLGIEHAANVLSIDSVGDGEITVTVSLDSYFAKQTMKLPCLITMEKDAYTPRLPSYKRKKEMCKKEIRVLTAADLQGIDPARLGLNGSPTQVERIFPPEKNADKKLFEGEKLDKKLFEVLKARKFI